MSGLAMFSLKSESLLQFDKSCREEVVRANLATLYGIEKAPCDTTMREQLDEVDYRDLRRAFTNVFAKLQRGKVLEQMTYLDNSYLFALDGTGYFSSNHIHCDQCCAKQHRNGTIEYYHQMLCGALVHPDCKEVIPFAPEPILKQDGNNKNDCERNAAKRLLTDLKREHPHLKLTIIEDGLSSNAPHIELIKSLGYHFILGAKPGDHEFMMDWVNADKNMRHIDIRDAKGVVHRFRYMNNVPLNDSNFNLRVNYLEYWEISSFDEVKHFSWVTDFTITLENLMSLMRGGRARWSIENETFNTLKNQGYHFEHNFGHGRKYLSSVFAHLMLLAFLLDQIQQKCCTLVQQAQKKMGSKLRFWERMRAFFFDYLIPSWESLYLGMINGLIPTVLPIKPVT